MAPDFNARHKKFWNWLENRRQHSLETRWARLGRPRFDPSVNKYLSSLKKNHTNGFGRLSGFVAYIQTSWTGTPHEGEKQFSLARDEEDGIRERWSGIEGNQNSFLWRFWCFVKVKPWQNHLKFVYLRFWDFILKGNYSGLFFSSFFCLYKNRKTFYDSRRFC